MNTHPADLISGKISRALSTISSRCSGASLLMNCVASLPDVHRTRFAVPSEPTSDVSPSSSPIADSSTSFDSETITATARGSVSYTHLRAHETRHDIVCRLLLEKKKTTTWRPESPIKRTNTKGTATTTAKVN